VQAHAAKYLNWLGMTLVTGGGFLRSRLALSQNETSVSGENYLSICACQFPISAFTLATGIENENEN
jgi:hypothetical protein